MSLPAIENNKKMETLDCIYFKVGFCASEEKILECLAENAANGSFLVDMTTLAIFVEFSTTTLPLFGNEDGAGDGDGDNNGREGEEQQPQRRNIFTPPDMLAGLKLIHVIEGTKVAVYSNKPQ